MKQITMIALAIMLFTSCKKEAQEINAVSTLQNAGKASVSRPFKVAFYTSQDTDPSIPPTACSGDIPGFANPGYFVHGEASHMGPLRALESRGQDVTCNISFATASLNTTVAGQLAANNGDLIYYTGADAFNIVNLLTGHPEIPGTVTGVWTITGGTGRFTGASGSFEFTGAVDFLTSTFSFTGEGTITY
jgi:hypothetical protein